MNQFKKPRQLDPDQPRFINIRFHFKLSYQKLPIMCERNVANVKESNFVDCS